MKKNLDDLSEIEQRIVQDYISNPRPGLGIDTVILKADESYVVFTDSESQSEE